MPWQGLVPSESVLGSQSPLAEASLKEDIISSKADALSGPATSTCPHYHGDGVCMLHAAASMVGRLQ